MTDGMSQAAEDNQEAEEYWEKHGIPIDSYAMSEQHTTFDGGKTERRLRYRISPEAPDSFVRSIFDFVADKVIRDRRQTKGLALELRFRIVIRPSTVEYVFRDGKEP